MNTRRILWNRERKTWQELPAGRGDRASDDSTQNGLQLLLGCCSYSLLYLKSQWPEQHFGKTFLSPRRSCARGCRYSSGEGGLGNLFQAKGLLRCNNISGDEPEKIYLVKLFWKTSSKQHSQKEQLLNFGCRELQRLYCHTSQWHSPAPVLCQPQEVHTLHSAPFCAPQVLSGKILISTQGPRATRHLQEHTAFNSGSVPTVVT